MARYLERMVGVLFIILMNWMLGQINKYAKKHALIIARIRL